MFFLISSFFKRSTVFIENELKEVIVHHLEAIFCKEHVINMEYFPKKLYHPMNIYNV